MDHCLTSTIGVQRLVCIHAETNLGPSPNLHVPREIKGVFQALSRRDFADLRRPDSKLHFEGRGYRYLAISPTGEFYAVLMQEPECGPNFPDDDHRPTAKRRQASE
jgi:hypothetical protein